MSPVLESKASFVEISLRDQNGQELLSFWASDNNAQNIYYSLKDQNPQKGAMQIPLPNWYLARGTYSLHIQEDLHHRIETFEITSPQTRTVLVQTPKQARAVEAWQGNNVAWAPVKEGFAVLPLNNGTWEVHTQNTNTAYQGHIPPNIDLYRIPNAPQPLPRPPHPTNNLLLLPALFALFCCGFILPKWNAKVLVGLVFALVAIPLFLGPVLYAPTQTMLQAPGNITDPSDSLALSTGMGLFSTNSFAFSFPEGSNWLTLGPSWLNYLPASLLSKWFNPILAHNFGFAWSAFLFGFLLWVMGRKLDLPPFTAGAYSLLVVLHPAILDEIDSCSLDRAALFVFPLCYLYIHQALERQDRKSLIQAGCALGVSIHIQLYYSLYFVLLLPVMILARSWRQSWRPLIRFIKLAPIALVLAVPALWVLQEGSEGAYTISNTTLPALDDISQKYANYFLQHSSTDLPTSSPTERILSASKRSLSLQDLYSLLLPFLPFLFLFFISRTQKKYLLLEILWLSILCLGPVLLTNNTWSATPLPYYWLMKWIPGVDQLKNVYRMSFLLLLLLPLPIFLLIRNRVSLLVPIAILLLGTRPLQHTKKIPTSKALQSIQGGNVCFLPLSRHTPQWMSNIAARYRLKLSNPPPFETSKYALTPISVDYPLLNRLSLLSQLGEIQQLHLANIDKSDTTALQELKLQWIVLPKNRIPTEERIVHLLDKHLKRWIDDEQYIIWKIETPY